jgi:hypothetical protein
MHEMTKTEVMSSHAGKSKLCNGFKLSAFLINKLKVKKKRR